MFGGRLDGGFHADDGHLRKYFTSIVQRGGISGITRDNDQFAAFVNQKANNASYKSVYLVTGARSIRHMALVANVDNRFVWEQVADFLQDRKAAHTGIKHSDGARIAGVSSGPHPRKPQTGGAWVRYRWSFLRDATAHRQRSVSREVRRLQ